MAKKAGLFRTLVVLGGTAAAVVLSKKENRDKAQNEYSKYKEDPESYKEKAKTELKKAKENPKGYASNAKSRLKKDDSDNTDLREAKFDDEGGTANGNLRIVTEEDLKK